MKKEELLSVNFLKQFKNVVELNAFVQQRRVEQILEGEMDAHLGYEKHEESLGENARNGHGRSE